MPVKQNQLNENAFSNNWFHGSISREQTENILRKQCQNGSFLIRFSTSTHKFVLSLIHQQQLYHYPIEELPDGFYQVNGTTAKYLGIDLLVSEFRRANNCIVCALGKPVLGSRPPSHIVVYGHTTELHAVNVSDLLRRISQSQKVKLPEIINEKSADSGATPLIEAAKTGSNDIVMLLLEHGAQVNLRDCGGFTALHRACQKSFAHVAETLLKFGKANPQIKCPFSGNTALHEAAMLGHTDCVNSLLRFHAAPWARNSEAEMSFEMAMRFGFTALAAALANYKPATPLTTRDDWFHPSLSKSDTDNLFIEVSAQKDGTFLIRKSSQSGKKYVLVLYYQRQTLKYQIEVIDFSFHQNTKEAYFIDKGPLHLTLEHLVEHYSRFADGIPNRLKYAISSQAQIVCLDNLIPQGVGKDLVRISNASGLNKCEERSRQTDSTLYFDQNQNMGAPLVMGQAGKVDNGKVKHLGIMANSLVPGSDIRLIPSEAVTLFYRLGEGEFGEVYRGQLHTDNLAVEEVAVKVLVQPSQRLDFLKEASIMMKLSHPHIIKIYGVCENKRLMMILELAEQGSLLDYLLDNPEKCLLPDLYNWAMQIANGMSYLESAGFVHRDLACRNVLLSTPTCAKISDFGLSRAVLAESDYYKATQRGKWPVKWYAPESIYYKAFSHASDVWSYGVCLWEMFSLGAHPYADQDSFEVLRQIEEGVRLPRPDIASDEVFAIMHDCWAYNPDARPTFAQLLVMFQHLATNVYENVDLVYTNSAAACQENKESIPAGNS